MADPKETYVYIQLSGEFVPAGLLGMRGQGRESSAVFEYGSKYLQRPNAISLYPVLLPLQKGRFFTRVGWKMLFGGIRDASPDGWGRHILDTLKEDKSFTEYDYLTASNDDRVGALAFGPDLSGPKRVFPFNVSGQDLHGETLNLEQMIHFSDAIENEEDLPLNKKGSLLEGQV